MTVKNILQINSSGRYEGSITRKVSDLILNNLLQNNPSCEHTTRDVAKGLPFVNEEWINANFTGADQRNDSQKAALKFSDSLVAELQQADHIVIAAPIYNFGIPATLKTWVDLISRAQLTFRYNDEGQPIGLLNNKKATIVTASGGVPIGSDWDKATPYLKHILSFIGINDVTLVNANEIETNNKDALDQVAALLS
jgi:FMN-dependent NADH-azoreductase